MAADPLPRQLAEMTRLLAEMATATAGAIQRATTALLERRERLAHRVIIGDAKVDALRAQVEEIATDALLFHAPVAGDLRAAVAAIRAAGDLERMGDLALHIAEAAQRGRRSTSSPSTPSSSGDGRPAPCLPAGLSLPG